jgi:hypothetical protein
MEQASSSWYAGQPTGFFSTKLSLSSELRGSYSHMGIQFRELSQARRRLWRTVSACVWKKQRRRTSHCPVSLLRYYHRIMHSTWAYRPLEAGHRVQLDRQGGGGILTGRRIGSSDYVLKQSRRTNLHLTCPLCLEDRRRFRVSVLHESSRRMPCREVQPSLNMEVMERKSPHSQRYLTCLGSSGSIVGTSDVCQLDSLSHVPHLLALHMSNKVGTYPLWHSSLKCGRSIRVASGCFSRGGVGRRTRI